MEYLAQLERLTLQPQQLLGQQRLGQQRLGQQRLGQQPERFGCSKK